LGTVLKTLVSWTKDEATKRNASWAENGTCFSFLNSRDLNSRDKTSVSIEWKCKYPLVFIRTLPRIDSDNIALVVDVGLGIPQVLDFLNLKFVCFLELILKMLLRRLGLHLTWVKGS
jgi:hypothetical protein